MSRRDAAVSVLTVVLFLGSACVSNAEPSEATATAVSEPRTPTSETPVPLPTVAEAEVEVAVALTEWTVLPDQPSVPAGPVSFVIENEGLLPHQFSVFWTELDAEEFPVERGVADALDALAVRASAASALVEPDGIEQLHLVLSPGGYVLLCNLPAHYEAGMRVPFTVE